MTDFRNDEEPVALKADGFDDAIIGFGGQWGSFNSVIYDRERCIAILVERDDMSYDEALEFFDFNVACAYVGPGTPIFMQPMTDLDELDELLG
jgi:hypothetical protein|tara:strand:- start:1 stop:279 length:279 start_codon:yes stop_codon:yes gene_type:complete